MTRPHPPRRRRLLQALLLAAMAPARATSAAAAAGGTGAAGAAGTAAPAGPAAAGGPASTPDTADDRIARGRVLRFPRDHGAHPGSRIEWWYATGWFVPGDASAASPAGAADGVPTMPLQGPVLGFQLTFFRNRTGLAQGLPGRLAPRQLLFAHAAVTDVPAGRHLHAQRLQRWSGDDGLPGVQAARDDARIALGRWQLQRDAASGHWLARLPAPDDGFALDLQLQPTQPVLLQGDAGFSRKGPLETQASHYYSLPQLAVLATLTEGSRSRRLAGRAWLDHEWSDELLAPDAQGWDWIGINLADGGALTAFQLRRADGSALWAGGSLRPAGGAVQAFAPTQVRMQPGRSWQSPATGARYPVEWQIETPAGRHTLRALLDAQELDSSASTGTVYWEGLAELVEPGGRRVGLGYLEMTGRRGPLRLG